MSCLDAQTARAIAQSRSSCVPSKKIVTTKSGSGKRESEEITRNPFSKILINVDLERYRETRPRRTPFLHVLLQRIFNPRLRHRTHNLVNRLSVLEDEQGRNSHDVEPTRRPRVLVRVQLPKSHLPLVLLSKRINYWGD